MIHLLLEKWRVTAVSYHQAVFYLPNLCKHCATTIASSFSKYTYMQKAGGQQVTFLLGSFEAHQQHTRKPSLSPLASVVPMWLKMLA